MVKPDRLELESEGFGFTAIAAGLRDCAGARQGDKMKVSSKLFATVGLSALMALPTAPVYAQLDEIIVTTRKRAETLQDAPLAVTAFTAESIARQGINNVRELASQVPGFNLNESFGRRDDRPAVRGSTTIGTPGFGVESGTAVFIDGVFVNADTSSFGLNDIERIEFVRGPQSALYGRNAYAGAVNFITKTPGDEFAFEGYASYAEHDQFEISANVSGPIVEGKLAGSFFARHYEYGGEYTNPFDGAKLGEEETNAFSGALFFEPNENVRARLRLAYSEDEDGHIPFVQVENGQDGVTINNVTNASANFGDNEFVAVGPNASSFGRDNYFDGELPVLDPKPIRTDLVSRFAAPGLERETFLATFRADWDILDGHELTLLAGYRNEDRTDAADSTPNTATAECEAGFPGATFDQCPNYFNLVGETGFPFGFIYSDPEDPALIGGVHTINATQEDTDEVSFELRLSSPQEQPFRWLFGGFYYNVEVDPLDLVTGVLDATGIRETDNWAVFGLAEYDFNEDWTATVELRYAEDKKTKTVLELGSTTDTFSVEETFTSTNPKFTLSWDVTDSVSAYASVARGNKPGGFNDRDNLLLDLGIVDEEAGVNEFLEGTPLAAFEEETSWVYEVGAKTSWLDNRLRINGALYFADIEDAQLTSTFASIIEGVRSGNSQIINVDSVETWGGEIELQAAPTENLSLSLGYAYTDPEIKEGGTVDQFDLTGDPSVAGNIFPRVSQHEFNWSADYSYPIANTDLDLIFNVNGSYDSKRYVQVHNLAEFGEATVWNSRIGIDHENYTIAIFGKNLGDEDAYVDALRFRDITVFGRRAFTSTLRKGRQIGVEARVRF